MPKEVSFVIRLDDKGTFKKVTVDAEGLGRAVRSVQDESEKAKRTIISWSEVSQAFDVLQNAISELQGFMTDLTSAYQVQLVAETQLQTIMRQRMGVNDEMIQSVKDLCSAQQELGVIGDEVQLSGAQQMATFLKSKQSLDVLIPAMNNLIAQQNGLNATNHDAVSIGNMMGKAMQGQVEVLQRVGITFTDAQKQVLQFGTESERAAMLAQVITDNVGNMNAELAKTDAGKWKQTENYLGDIKEQLGAMVQQYAPTITFLSQATIAASGIGKLATSFYSVGKALGIVKAATIAWNATAVRMSALATTCSASMRGAAVSATTLKLAIQGLMMATGVGVAVAALTGVISLFASSSDDAAMRATNMANAEKSAFDNIKQTYDSTLKQTYANLIAKYEQMKTSWQSMKSEHEKTQWVKNNKTAFEELGLKINSIADAENAFTKNTEKVKEAFEKRAQAAAYAAELVELYKQQLDLKNRKQNVDSAIKSARDKYNNSTSVSNQDNPYATENANRQANLAGVISDIARGGDGNIDKLNANLKIVNTKIAETKTALKGLGNVSMVDPGSGGGKTSPTKTSTIKTDNTTKTHLEELQSQLKKAQDELGNATTIEAKIKADAKVKDIQGEIDEATKGKVTIGAQVDSSYIVQGSDADKRLSRNNAQQRIDRIKQDYDIGIIADKSEAQRQIDDLNKQLTELGLKPIEVHWEAHTEELQRQLQDAQREFDNATTIEAKLKASAKLADLQAQIDTETKGRLTIAADVKPSYIEQGSIADKRQSYSNAQAKAIRIQQDFEIGIIGKDDARKQIAELNAELESLADGLKPIKIDVDSQGFSRAMDKIKSAWGGIQSIGSGVESITSALEGDKNAWESLTGVVSGFIQIMEGVLSAVEIVKMLTTATHAHTAAKAAETAATGASTVASAADAAGKTAEAAASAPVVLANKLSTASFLELASASYFAAHAYIPFAGFGIASGFASAAVAMTKSMGAMAFATGGIVGGNSKSGDRVLVRVNSGEMILNAAQQAQLFAIANGRMQPTVNTDVLTGLMAGGAGGVKAGSVVGKIRGRDIVLVAANETRQMRRRSNIKI